MTRIEKARQYLESGQWLHGDIECLQSIKQDERKRLEHYGQSRSKEYKDFEKTVDMLIVKTRDALEERCNLVDQIKDERLRRVLRLHFIEGKTFVEVANEMFFSLGYITNRLQLKALSAAADVLGLEDD